MKNKLDHRRVLTWLMAGGGVAALVVVSNSLLIGYLLACLPLLIVACFLHQRTRAASPSSLPRWLVWVPLALVMPLGLWLLLTYLFGDLGVAIRSFTTSIFEPA